MVLVLYTGCALVFYIPNSTIIIFASLPLKQTDNLYAIKKKSARIAPLHMKGNTSNAVCRSGIIRRIKETWRIVEKRAIRMLSVSEIKTRTSSASFHRHNGIATIYSLLSLSASLSLSDKAHYWSTDLHGFLFLAATRRMRFVNTHYDNNSHARASLLSPLLFSSILCP